MNTYIRGLEPGMFVILVTGTRGTLHSICGDRLHLDVSGENEEMRIFSCSLEDVEEIYTAYFYRPERLLDKAGNMKWAYSAKLVYKRPKSNIERVRNFVENYDVPLAEECLNTREAQVSRNVIDRYKKAILQYMYEMGESDD